MVRKCWFSTEKAPSWCFSIRIRPRPCCLSASCAERACVYAVRWYTHTCLAARLAEDNPSPASNSAQPSSQPTHTHSQLTSPATLIFLRGSLHHFTSTLLHPLPSYIYSTPPCHVTRARTARRYFATPAIIISSTSKRRTRSHTHTLMITITTRVRSTFSAHGVLQNRDAVTIKCRFTLFMFFSYFFS